MMIFITYIFFTVVGLILMKLGGNQLNLNINKGALNFSIGFTLLIAFVMYGISFLIWSRIVAKNDLSYIMPISSGIVNVLSVVAGVVIFKENLSLIQVIGIIVAIIGICLINIK